MRCSSCTKKKLVDDFYLTNSEVCKDCLIKRQRYPSSREALLEKPTTKRGDGVYLISSVIVGNSYNKELFDNLESFAGLLGAEIILIGIKSTLRQIKARVDYYPVRSLQYLHRKVKFGIDTVFEDVGLRPSIKHPMSGLDDVNDGKNFFVGHPRLNSKYIPKGVDNKCKVGSTGTISKLCFDSTTKANKTLMKGFRYGFRIVTIKDGKLYSDIPVEPNISGQFLSSGIVAKIVGDMHSDRLGMLRKQYIHKFMGKYKSTYTIFHDFVSCESVSHHNDNKPFSKDVINKRLKAELTGAQLLLREFRKIDSESIFVFPYSNHDDHAIKWLDSFRWANDENNREFAIEFSQYMSEVNPTVAYITKHQEKSKIEILRKDQSFNISGYNLGQHGHTLTYGRANPVSLNKGLGKGVCGHFHNETCLSNVWFVGKSCDSRQGYNEYGDLSTPSHCLIFGDGSRCMLRDDRDIDLKLEEWGKLVK